MLAAVYHGPNDLRVEQVPRPEPRPVEALVRVLSASICGTDLRILHGGHRKYPPGTVRIPGHEMVGLLEALDPAMPGLKIGQRVFVAPNIGCGHCKQCISGQNNRCANYEAIGVTFDGAFAEYVRIPVAGIQQGCLIPVNEQDDPAAQALIEPFACVVRGQNALRIQPGELVLVMGAGPIGMMHTKLAHLRGARRVIVSEPNPARLLQARAMGADRLVNPQNEDLASILREESNGDGADVIIVAAPNHQAQEDALKLAGIGGRINFFGGLPSGHTTINFDSNLVHYKELVVMATTACSTADCRQATDILNSGRIDLSDLVSLRFPLAQANEAFKAAETGQSLKVVLQP